MASRWIVVAGAGILALCSLLPEGMGADPAAPQFVYVCQDAGAGGFQAWPDVCRLKDGRLMCAFYGGYAHGSPPSSQHPKSGGIFYCTSRDEGHSWSKVNVLYDGPDDEHDASLVQLKNGRIICNFFIERYADGKNGASLGTWIMTSDDLAKTWSKPRQVYAPPYYTSSPIRELSDGRLLLPLYKATPSTAAGAVGISDDGGATWSKAVDIPNGGHRLDAETDVIELTDGSLYAVQRPVMSFSVSKDRGNTWSVSKPIGFPGHAPYLLRTRDGIIVLAHRVPGTSLHYSLDEGKSWSDNVPVDVVGGAYPSMVNLKDGSVLIVYYEEGAGSSIRAKRFRAMRGGIEWLVP